MLLFAIRSVEVMFFVGLAGSVVVLVLTAIDDFGVLISSGGKSQSATD
jgi:hypothetical protein